MTRKNVYIAFAMSTKMELHQPLLPCLPLFFVKSEHDWLKQKDWKCKESMQIHANQWMNTFIHLRFFIFATFASVTAPIIIIFTYWMKISILKINSTSRKSFFSLPLCMSVAKHTSVNVQCQWSILPYEKWCGIRKDQPYSLSTNSFMSTFAIKKMLLFPIFVTTCVNYFHQIEPNKIYLFIGENNKLLCLEIIH